MKIKILFICFTLFFIQQIQAQESANVINDSKEYRDVDKMWLLIQKPKVEKIKKLIDKQLIESEGVLKKEMIVGFLDRYDSLLLEMEIVLDGNRSNVEKEEKIDKIIDNLSNLYLQIRQFYKIEKLLPG